MQEIIYKLRLNFVTVLKNVNGNHNGISHLTQSKQNLSDELKKLPNDK